MKGAEQVRRSIVGHKATFVFIAPPSMEELERRLRGRGTEDEDHILTRLGAAAQEMAASQEPGFFHEVVVNNDEARAYAALKAAIARHIHGESVQ